MTSERKHQESRLSHDAGAHASDLLVVDRVSKRYGSTEVLRDISLTVTKGEVLCVLGSSGGGKSTWLR